MGYSYKNIDKRRQEAPFLILEKNIYKNLNVGTIAKVLDIYNGGMKLQTVPTGINLSVKYTLVEETYNRGDLVLVLILDNYGTEDLNEITENILHDYRNAVVLGKLHNL